MAEQSTVFKKLSPNGKFMVYLRCREYASVSEPIDGGVVVNDEYLEPRKIFAQLVAHFRYGRQNDEVMGLKFYKDFILASNQIYPPVKENTLTLAQCAIRNKVNLTSREMYPFTFYFPEAAPTSVSLFSKDVDFKNVCGIRYYVKIFISHFENDVPHQNETVKINIRRVLYAPDCSNLADVPAATTRKEFQICRGSIELEATLNKHVYQANERIPVNINIQNYSNKEVKKMTVTLLQSIRIRMLQNAHYTRIIDECLSLKGFPVYPGFSVQSSVCVTPKLTGKPMKDGVALNGHYKAEECDLASSTYLHFHTVKDSFGIVVNYYIKVKLYLGNTHGKMCTELPLIIMPVKPTVKNQRECK